MAAHAALHLPKILSLILRELAEIFLPDKTYRRREKTILSCTLVNTLWHDTANRYLWKVCGPQRYPTLISLLPLPPAAQQQLANYIQVLQLDSRCARTLTEPDHDGRPTQAQLQHSPEDGSLRADRSLVVFELQNTSMFTSATQKMLISVLVLRADSPGLVSYPALRELQLDERHPTIDYMPISPSQFLQPSIRVLSVTANHAESKTGITNAFFDELWKSCPGLVSLELCILSKHAPGPKHIDPSTVSSCIAKLLMLKKFSLLMEENELSCFSSQAFAELAIKPGFEHLDIETIQDPWLQDFRDRALQSSSLFSSLKTLKCGISTEALTTVLPCCRQLRELQISARGANIHLLKPIADTPLLYLIRLFVVTDQLEDVSDLLQIARNSTNLESLEVRQGQEGSIRFDVQPTDETFDAIAQSLPKLRRLSIEFAGEPLTTEKSLFSLGTHCPNLEALYLTAIVDCEKLVQKSVCWPNLQELFTTWQGDDEPDEYEWDSQPNPSDVDLAGSTPRWRNDLDLDITDLMPSLFSFRVYGSKLLGYRIQHLLQDIEGSRDRAGDLKRERVRRQAERTRINSGGHQPV